MPSAVPKSRALDRRRRPKPAASAGQTGAGRPGGRPRQQTTRSRPSSMWAWTFPALSTSTSSAAPPTRNPVTRSAPSDVTGRTCTVPPGTSGSIPRNALTRTNAAAAAHACGRQAAGYGTGTGIFVGGESAVQLRQSSPERRAGGQQSIGQHGGLGMATGAQQAVDGNRRVVWPHRPAVIAQGGEPAAVDAIVRSPKPLDMLGWTSRAATAADSSAVEHPGAEQMSHVRGRCVDRPFVRVQRQRRIVAEIVADPEPLAEPLGDPGGVAPPMRPRPADRTPPTGRPRPWPPRGRSPAPRQARWGRSRSGRRPNRTESAESFQPWFARPRPERSTYSNRPSPSASPKSRHPAERALGSRQQGLHDRRIEPEPPRLGQQTDPERCRVHRAVVDRRECGVAVVGPAQFVQHLLRVPRRSRGSSCDPLPGGERDQGARGEFGAQRQQHPRRPQRVASEEGEVPRRARRQERVIRRQERGHPQRVQVGDGRSDQGGQPAIVGQEPPERPNHLTFAPARRPRPGPRCAPTSPTVSCRPGGTRISQQNIYTRLHRRTSDTTGLPPTDWPVWSLPPTVSLPPTRRLRSRRLPPARLPHRRLPARRLPSPCPPPPTTERPEPRPGGRYSETRRPSGPETATATDDCGTSAPSSVSRHRHRGPDRPALTAQIPARSVVNRSRSASSTGSSRTLLTVMDSAHPNGTARRCLRTHTAGSGTRCQGVRTTEMNSTRSAPWGAAATNSGSSTSSAGDIGCTDGEYGGGDHPYIGDQHTLRPDATNLTVDPRQPGGGRAQAGDQIVQRGLRALRDRTVPCDRAVLRDPSALGLRTVMRDRTLLRDRTVLRHRTSRDVVFAACPRRLLGDIVARSLDNPA